VFYRWLDQSDRVFQRNQDNMLVSVRVNPSINSSLCPGVVSRARCVNDLCVIARSAPQLDQRQGLCGADACDAAWRRAVETWLHRNGVITVSVDGEVLPCFRDLSRSGLSGRNIQPPAGHHENALLSDAPARVARVCGSVSSEFALTCVLKIGERWAMIQGLMDLCGIGTYLHRVIVLSCALRSQVGCALSTLRGRLQGSERTDWRAAAQAMRRWLVIRISRNVPVWIVALLLFLCIVAFMVLSTAGTWCYLDIRTGRVRYETRVLTKAIWVQEGASALTHMLGDPPRPATTQWVCVDTATGGQTAYHGALSDVRTLDQLCQLHGAPSYVRKRLAGNVVALWFHGQVQGGGGKWASRYVDALCDMIEQVSAGDLPSLWDRVSKTPAQTVSIVDHRELPIAHYPDGRVMDK
jgi:hypothetical protein